MHARRNRTIRTSQLFLFRYHQLFSNGAIKYEFDNIRLIWTNNNFNEVTIVNFTLKISELFLTCDYCIMYAKSAYQQQKSKCCDALKISAGVTFEHSGKGATMLWKNRDKKSWCISTIMNSGRIWWILIPKMGLAAVYDLGHLKLVNQFWPADEKIFILIRLPHP